MKESLYYIFCCFQYELLMCVQDKNDPVIDLVHQLQKSYPKVDCQLIIGENILYLK